eukprot:SAG25_NODE_14636_length_252_cov_1.019608_1_plen_53_part_01
MIMDVLSGQALISAKSYVSGQSLLASCSGKCKACHDSRHVSSVRLHIARASTV